MFRQKKSEENFNEYDLTLKRLISTRREKYEQLISCVQDIIIKKDVIELYPAGADKEKAKQDFQRSQNILLTYIAEFDDIYCQLQNFEYSKCKYYITDKTAYESVTSHSIIESTYRNFLLRG